jgi:hypothetical protein
VDVFIIPSLPTYAEKSLKSIEKADLDLEAGDTEGQEDALDAGEVNHLIALFKETLGDRVEDVIPSKRLVGSAEIEVAFGAVIEHKGFAMSVRVEGSGIEIQITIDFDGRNRESCVLQQTGERSRKDAFAHTGHDATRDDDVFGAANTIVWRKEIQIFRIVTPRTDFFAIEIVHGGPYI